jgi:hypothetical protein
MRAIMEEIDVGRVFASNAHATRRRRRLSTARRGCDASTRFSLSLFTRFLLVNDCRRGCTAFVDAFERR